MCVLYVSFFGLRLDPEPLGVVLFILGSRLFLYSAGSGVNRVQAVLSVFSVRLLCLVQTKHYLIVWVKGQHLEECQF